jgi:PEP-CTERM motif
MVAACSAFAGPNLISDGDFSSPNQFGGWSIYYPGVNGWVNTNGDGIEIGYSPIYGLPCDNGGCQNLEVNANTFDTDSYTVSGLTVGSIYTLSWDYGGRTSGGPDYLDVSFGGTHLTTDGGSIGYWTLNSFLVKATSSTEALVFASEVTGGLPSYGNEITNVSLSAPEPSTWAMMLAGFAGLGCFRLRPQRASSVGLSRTAARS